MTHWPVVQKIATPISPLPNLNHTNAPPVNSDILKWYCLFRSHCKKLYEVPTVGHLPGVIRTMLPKWFQGNIFCAGLPIQNYSACHGDSGGPLIKFMDMEHAHYEQIGKTFFLYCCSGGCKLVLFWGITRPMADNGFILDTFESN